MSFGSGSPHTGKSTAATTDQAPVANVTAGQYSFKTAARPCIVSNATGALIYGFTNKTGIPTATDHHWAIAGAGWRDLSEGGAVNVRLVSVWVTTGGTVANLQVKGWLQ